MARARNIKPGFFKNEDLAECSPWARLCFAGLWTLADREGRLEDRPKRIKGELFAYDSVEVEPLLAELERFGFIERYRNQDGSFIQISKFSDHQTPHYSEKPSVIKPPNFQEYCGDDDHEIPRGLQEDSRKDASLRGGRNPLNPDSLNPDSPIPDSGYLNPEEIPSVAVATVSESADAGFDLSPDSGSEPLKPGLPDCPYAKLLSLWREHLPHLTQPRAWEGSRRQSMRARWAQAAKPSDYSPKGYTTEADGIAWWASFFAYIANDTRLSAGFESNGRTWKPDLEWVCNAANFQKIIDGKYES